MHRKWFRCYGSSLTIVVVAVAVVVVAVSLDCHLDRLCMGLDGTGGKYEQDYRLISPINSQVGVIVLRALRQSLWMPGTGE